MSARREEVDMGAKYLGRGQFIALAALIISFFGNFLHAAAIEFAPVGMHGDAGARDVCPTGHYLIGANARTGAWVDQISIRCSPPINPDGIFGYGPPPPGPKRGGEGGSPSDKTCGLNEIVFGMGLLHTDGNRQVRVITFNCVLTTGTARHNVEIGPQAPLFPTTTQNCPEGEAAIGLQVRYGQHVNALGPRLRSFYQTIIRDECRDVSWHKYWRVLGSCRRRVGDLQCA
jgi:hypothetical protein